MTAALWKRRFSILIALIIVCSFVAEAAADTCLTGRRRYKVRIDSAPQGAQIFIGQESCGTIGTTPWEGELPKGTWTVILKKDGYDLARKSFRVRRTRRLQDLLMPMVKQPDPPRIEVRADADKNAFNAEVWVDGQRQGQIPSVIKVDEGRHLVEIKKAGFEDFQQWIEVNEGQKATVNPVLKALKVVKKGRILVEADVPGAEVYLDGNKHKDNTPTLIEDVIAGPHVIEVKKDPAVPWKVTLTVEEGKTAKVSAELKATIGGPVGTIRVLSNVEGARVYLDGSDKGPAPVDLKDVKPGEHVVEVKAKGHVTREQRVMVNAGSAEIVKLDLEAEVSTQTGSIKVVSPVPEAAVFIDGERVGNVPQEKEVAPGEHFVVVTKAGYRKYEEKVRVTAGKAITVQATLQAVGALRILSNPAGAEVVIDGESVGTTPFNKDDIEVGDHIVVLKVRDYFDFEREITIKGGERTIVRGTLDAIDRGPTPEELEREQRGLSSFGAVALPLGRATIDVSGGYPYYAASQIIVGAPQLANRFPFDAGLLVRTFLSRTELGLRLRLTLAEKRPFSAGVFVLTGGGSNLVDDSGRNSFFFDTGLLASLTAPGNITVTGRAYINFWSDRHCDVASGDGQLDVCRDMTVLDEGRLGELGFDNRADLEQRESGFRAMASIVAELAFRQRWTLWFMLEGAPFQAERAAYVNQFSGLIPFDDDILTYVQGGVTYKF